jgi:hypothetical protein
MLSKRSLTFPHPFRFSLALLLLILLVATFGRMNSSIAFADTSSTVTNFDSANHQITRYDTRGNAIDAHDGEISATPTISMAPVITVATSGRVLALLSVGSKCTPPRI